MQQALSMKAIFSLIVKHSGQIFIISDIEGKVIYVNDQFEEITGHNLRIGNSLFDIPVGKFLRKIDIESISHLYKLSLLENKKQFSFNILKRPVVEQEIWYRITNKAIKITENDYYFLHLVDDISQLKQTEKLLTEEKIKAEENDRLKSAFLANMSHEIRTPMNTILGFTKLLAESNDAEEKEQFSEIVKTSGAHLLNLINDIIDVSKIEAGFQDVKLVPSNINKLLSDLKKLFKHDKRLVSKKIKLAVELSLPDFSAHILTDETRLHQVISNLIDNAIKFTVRGKISFGYNLIDETYSDGTPKLQFFVKDSGIGIPKEELKQVFERFHQLDGEGKKMGTGLGLTIVKALIKMLGGEIWVDSVFGEGTTFYFNIPYLQKKPKAEVEITKRSSKVIADFQNKVILIAEDVESNYQYLEVLLRKTKAELLWVKNGKEAVSEVLSGRKIDLILIDLRMPVMNGYDATKQIKLIKPKLPILAVTAFAIDGDMEKAFDFGCDDYITKPVEKDELLKKIKLFIE